MSSDFFDFMKTNKDSLDNILRRFNNNTTFIDIINDAIFRTNKIVIHTYNFIKLYFIHLFDFNLPFPIIDKIFVQTVMKVITKRNSNRTGNLNSNTKNLIKKLTFFFNSVYKNTIIDSDIVCDDNLCYILPYEAIDIVTNINNNLIQHYVQHVHKYINIIFGWKDKIKEINDNKTIDADSKKLLKNKLYMQFSNIKYDVLNVSDNVMISSKKYHKRIKELKKLIIPEKTLFSKNSIYYDIHCNPQDYIIPLIFINNHIEIINIQKGISIKLFHVFPLRTKIVPCYVIFDTASLISLFITENSNQYYQNIKAEQYKIWNKFFHLNKKVFNKNGYHFNFMIKTDGVACSIIFIKLDKNNVPMKKIPKGKIKKMDENREKAYNSYIEDQDNIKQVLKDKNYVCIDPNASDLMHCMDVQGNKFRYTQDQRRLESKNKKYMKIVETINKETLINGKSVIDIQSTLSENNSKTCSFLYFFDYLIGKNNINRKLFKQYQEKIYRKLNWNRFINTQKSESKMIKNFQNVFGSPKNTIIIFGDYDKKNNLKGKEPFITKHLRKLLRLAGFTVYLINEYHTSKLCNKCQHEVENFKRRESKKPKNKGQEILVWGLVCCTNKNCKPNIKSKSKKQANKYGSSIYNRDTNAVLNMLHIVKQLIKTNKRPKEYEPKNEIK